VEVLKDKPVKVSVTTVKGDWDWGFYESEHGTEATSQFRRAVEAVATLVANRGWDIQHNLNKYYTGFKLGNKVVFSVAWGATYTWKLRFKIPEETAQAFVGKQWEFQIYDATFKEATFRPLQPDGADIVELEPLFVEAYKHISGTK